ncbi:MAG: glycosyltransferase [Planctomycetaceae bacterium]|nr:glycosyltransferase [Planctomycetaceae bacterium]
MTTVSIVISTRNRREDVIRAVESCLAQEYTSFEVLVYDDASSDGTADAISEHFPEVKLHRSSEHAGYLVWRNHGFRDAIGEFVVSIDDDSYFTDRGTLAQLVELFQRFPRAAAIALPYLEPMSGRRSGRNSAASVGTQLRHYIGCAHAVRRQLVLELGGYPEELIHQGEERDLCLRMLERGWQVICGDTPPLVHLYSQVRDRERLGYYGYRNTLLFNSIHVPHPYLVPRMLTDSFLLMSHGARCLSFDRIIKRISAGWWAAFVFRHDRHPVSRMTYRTYRALPSHGPVYVSREQLPAALKRSPSSTQRRAA